MDIHSFKKELTKLDLQIFSLNEAQKILQVNKNTLYTTLSRWTNKKHIHRIRKGWYSTEPLENKFLIQATYPNTYIGLRSAIEYHGKTTQRYNTIDLLIEEPKKTQHVSTYTVAFHTSKHHFGYYKERIDTQEIFVSNIEKTVIDLIHFSHKVPLQTTETFINKAKEEIDTERLKDYLLHTNINALTKRVGFLLQKHGVTLDIQTTKPYQKLDKTQKKEGRRIPRWNIIDNAN